MRNNVSLSVSKAIFISFIYLCAFSTFGSDFISNGIAYTINSDFNSVAVDQPVNNQTINLFVPAEVMNDGICYTVTSIGENAFSDCTNLVSIILPNTISSIGKHAFSGCSKLKSIVLPSSVVYVGTGAFLNCNSLSSMTLCASNCDNFTAGATNIQNLFIGQGVLSIKSLNVSPLHVFCYSNMPPICDESSFTSYFGTLHVPENALSTYFVADYWDNFINLTNDAMWVNSITLNETQTNMRIGETIQLIPTVIPNSNSGDIIWASTNPDIVTVDSNGFVTAINKGEANIVVATADKYDICHISVCDIPVVITLDYHNATIEEDQIFTIKASHTPNSSVIEYVINNSNDDVALVRLKNNIIQVLGVSPGSTTIKVSSSDGEAQSDSCMITVKYRKGDINCDGCVNSSDITALYDYFLNGDETFLTTSDVNGDGSITSADITAIYDILLGNEDDVILNPEDVTMPGKEIRAVWLTTVRCIDWPRNQTNPEVQKQEFIEYLDLFKQYNVNTVFMQVRPCADAFYNSSFEPWSQYLTGTQGQDPGWDVMNFVIEETHKRGMEFHAWMTPYRICENYTTFNPAANAISNIHPDWVMQYGKLWILNPGLPEVRQHLCNVVADLLDKYDVDGIHFDDNFYPYPDGSSLPDMDDYHEYGVPAGFTSIANWRRDNVNKAIEAVHNTILAHKPGAVFSISPFCVWRNSSVDPRGSLTYTSISNYDSLYADILKWCEENWIDLVVPKLYYTTQNTNANFITLVNWWPEHVGTCPLAIGLELDLYSSTHSQTVYQTTAEIEREFFYARQQPKVQGFFLYCAKVFKENKINLLDKIAEMYPEQSVIPFIGRETVDAPTPLIMLKSNGMILSWEDKGNDMRYVVYKIDSYDSYNTNFAHVIDIIKDNHYLVSEAGYYAVSVLNQDNMESSIVIEKVNN